MVIPVAWLVSLCSPVPVIPPGPASVPQPAVIIARDLSDAERLLGEQASVFFASGAPGAANITRLYPNAGATLWTDPRSGLVVGFATRVRATNAREPNRPPQQVGRPGAAFRILPTVVQAATAAASSQLAPGGQLFVRPGMTRAEVERLLGEPFHGFTRLGDPHALRLTAEYRCVVRSVTYQHGVVVHVEPPYRAVRPAGEPK